MTVPGYPTEEPTRSGSASSLLRAAIWVAIGALIAAAIVCVVWIFLGEQNGIVGRAFLTILLLVAFAGVAILDAHLAERRPAWFALSSMIGWVALLLVGAVMVWMPERYEYSGISRFVQFLVIVLIVQLALLHIRLYMKASRRFVTGFTQVVTVVTISLVVGLAALLSVPLVLWEYVTFTDLYWRVIVAVAILAAVGTALVPLVNVLFAPKKAPAYDGYSAPAHHAQQVPPAVPALVLAPAPAPVEQQHPQQLPWPTFVDGVTPLPVMPDGQPDWGAYYSGYPSPGAQIVGHPAPAPEPVAPHAPQTPPPGYEGFPPPPPLPPRG